MNRRDFNSASPCIYRDFATCTSPEILKVTPPRMGGRYLPSCNYHGKNSKMECQRFHMKPGLINRLYSFLDRTVSRAQILINNKI